MIAKFVFKKLDTSFYRTVQCILGFKQFRRHSQVWQTDRQTDRRTDVGSNILDAIVFLNYAPRLKWHLWCSQLLVRRWHNTTWHKNCNDTCCTTAQQDSTASEH